MAAILPTEPFTGVGLGLRTPHFQAVARGNPGVPFWEIDLLQHACLLLHRIVYEFVQISFRESADPAGTARFEPAWAGRTSASPALSHLRPRPCPLRARSLDAILAASPGRRSSADDCATMALYPLCPCTKP